MIAIVREPHLCVQSQEPFTCFILIVDDRRIFSTEDARGLRGSAAFFREEDDVAVALDCDRNSAESPELGPALEAALPSPLYLRRLGGTVRFETGRDAERVVHLIAPLECWLAAVHQC